FAVDPVIIRIGFVLLTVIGGGSGVLLYLLGWLIIAKEGDGDTNAMRALRGSPEGNRGLLLIVLVLGALFILGSPLIFFGGFGIGDGRALPLLLVAAGVAFLIWPGDRDWQPTPRRPRPADPVANPDAFATEAAADDLDSTEPALDPETGAPMSTRDEIRMELRTARDEVKSELAEARDSFRDQRREWRHGYRAERRAQRRAARPPREPKPAPFLGPLTIAVLLVFAGVSMVGEQADWWDLDPAVYAGTTLAIIGLGLVVSAFFGRARGLIFAGLIVLPIAWGIAAIDLDWHEGVGEQTDVVRTITELEDNYSFGVGEYELDLSQLELLGEDRTIEVGLTIGELRIWIPDTMNVGVQADARLGELELLGRDTFAYDDEFEPSVAAGFPGTEPGTLLIDADVGLGVIRVFECDPDVDAQPTGALVTCP
ncbi:MAG: LiaF domain-containing protein, partial [Actinomycetota bacterium]